MLFYGRAMQKSEPQGGSVWGFSSGSGFCMMFKEEICKKRSHAEGPFACCFKEELCKNQSHAEGRLRLLLWLRFSNIKLMAISHRAKLDHIEPELVRQFDLIEWQRIHA